MTAPPTAVPAQPSTLGLQTRVLLLFGAVLLITLAIITISVYTLVANAEIGFWAGRQQEAARSASVQVSQFLARAEDELGFLSEQEYGPQTLSIVADTIEANPSFLQILVADSQARLFISESRGDMIASEFIIRQAPWFQATRDPQAELYVSHTQYTTANEPYLIVASSTAAGEAIAVWLDMTLLSRIIADARFGETGSAYVIDENGHVIAHNDPQVVAENTFLGRRPELQFFRSGGDTQEGNSYTNFQGLPVIGTSQAIAGTEWVMVTEVSIEEATASSRSALLLLSGFTILFWGGAMAVSNVFLRTLVFRPLNNLLDGTQAVERGNLHYQVVVEQQDEIGKVTEGFNAMVRQLERRGTEREQLLTRTATLYALTQRLTTVYDETALLQIIGDAVPSGQGNSTTLWRYDTDSKRKTVQVQLIANSVQGNMTAFPVGMTFAADDFPLAALAKLTQYEIVLIADVARDERLDNRTRAFLKEWQIGRLAVATLKQGERRIGLLIRTWIKPQFFSDNERELYRSIPPLLAPVVENLSLIRNLENNVAALKVATRVAQEGSRLKSEFLAMMSHELRTPMNAIEGFLGIMLNGMGGVQFNERTDHYLRRVNSNSKRLLDLINDFLDLSRVEAGRLELAHVPVPLRWLAQRWQDEIGILADKKGIKLEVMIDPTLPAELYGDEDAISKVVTNLLSNAIKFTEQGTISIAMENGGAEWRIVVADTGIGIPPHARDFIFEEFRQVDQSSRRKYGGTGLGLAIAQKYTRTMGGTLTLKSEVGQGSIFTVSLPLEHVESMAEVRA